MGTMSRALPTGKRRIRPRLLVTVALIPSLLAFGSMGGCAYFKDWRDLPRTHDEERTLYVVSHGWHTGIVLARTSLGAELGFIEHHLGASAYYEIGFGDKAYYQAERETFWITMKAALWPTPSTLHVVAVPTEPALYFPTSEVIALRVSERGERRLVATIAQAFATDAQGRREPTHPGLYGNSLFYDGVESFHLANLCNAWTARLLATAGVPTTTFLTLTAGSVMRQSRWAANKYHCCTPP